MQIYKKRSFYAREDMVNSGGATKFPLEPEVFEALKSISEKIKYLTSELRIYDTVQLELARKLMAKTRERNDLISEYGDYKLKIVDEIYNDEPHTC